nr:uncharacterized protein LOC102068158 [Zonotrichia albicollis]XP_026651270.1 uncharacterized protein LOC102068158 [Zonotrichia albicollis]
MMLPGGTKHSQTWIPWESHPPVSPIQGGGHCHCQDVYPGCASLSSVCREGQRGWGEFLTDMDTQTLSHHPPSLLGSLIHTSISTQGGRGDTGDTHRDPNASLVAQQGGPSTSHRGQRGGCDHPNFRGVLLVEHPAPRLGQESLWGCSMGHTLAWCPWVQPQLWGTRGCCGVQVYLGSGRSHSAPKEIGTDGCAMGLLRSLELSWGSVLGGFQGLGAQLGAQVGHCGWLVCRSRMLSSWGPWGWPLHCHGAVTMGMLGTPSGPLHGAWQPGVGAAPPGVLGIAVGTEKVRSGCQLWVQVWVWISKAKLKL